MVVTLLGMTTDVIKCPAELSNALSPILIVGNPPSVEGIVIAPPAPVYSVMVATSSFIV